MSSIPKAITSRLVYGQPWLRCCRWIAFCAAKACRAVAVGVCLLVQCLALNAQAQSTFAYRPISGTASSNFGSPYTMNMTIDSSEVSSSYTSGVTSFSTVETFTTVGGGGSGQWFGVYGTASGDLVYDMGQTIAMDRVRFHWANAGGSNSISCLFIDVSNSSAFTSFTTVVSNYAKPAGSAATVLFNQASSGRYLRIRWTCLAFGASSYPGLNEIVVGGRLSGLTGNYYNTTDLTGAVALSRLDGPVDFDWLSGSPGPGVNADFFSVRWTGSVLAPSSGWYTFQTQSDDGVRLWFNGQQIISNWTLHGPTDDTAAAVYLKAGTRYPIEMNMYEWGGGAVARLRWKKPSDAAFIAIPSGDGTQGLYPDTVAVVPDAGLLTGAVWWGRAGSFSGSDSAPMVTWDNDADSSRHLAGSATRPTFRNTNALNINFNPVVEFTSTTDTVAGAQFFTAPSMLGASNHPQEHLLFVGYPTANNRNTTLVSELGSGSSFYTHLSWSDGLVYFDPGVSSGIGSLRSIYTPTRFLNAPSLYAMLNNASSTANLPLAGNHGIRQDGQTKVVSSNAASTTGINSNFRVGWPGQNQTWNGVLAEGLLLLDKQLTPTELTQLESYLGVKYGISLGGNGATTTSYLNSTGGTVWSANTGFHNNIVGVGRDDTTKLNQLISRSVNTGDQITIISGAAMPSSASVFSPTTGATALATDRSYTIIGDNGQSATGTASITVGAQAGRTRSSRIWRLQMTGTVPTQLSICIPDSMLPSGFTAGAWATDLWLTTATAADFSIGTAQATMTVATCVASGVGVTTGVPGRIATISNTVLNGMGGVGYFTVTRKLLDHIEVTASANTGVTCAPTTYTIKACGDAACTSLYTGGLTGTLTLTGTGVTTVFPAGAGFTIASGASTTTVSAQVTSVSTATVGASGLSLTPANATPLWCGLGSAAASSGSCAMTVGNAGFLFSVANHYAGASQTVSIKAVRSSDNAQVCIPAFASVTRTVKATCSYVNPASGGVPVQLGAVKLNSGNTNSACDATGQNVSLAFDANGAASTTLSYWDAGKARLNLAYSGSAGTNDTGLSLAGTADFVAAPMGFIVTDYPNVATAGSPFSFKIKALAHGSNANVLPNFGQESPREGVVLDWVRSEPLGSGAQTGSFTGSVGLFSAGVADVSNASWSEVGRISPTVRLASDSYLSSGLTSAGNPIGVMGWTYCASESGGSANPCVIPSGVAAAVYFGVNASAFLKTGQSGAVPCSTANFGDPTYGWPKACYYTPLSGSGSVATHIQVRPARLEVSAAAACGSFSYAGQPFGVTVTAKNALNAVTQNYAGTVARTVNLSDSTASSNGSLSGSVPASAFNLGVATLANTVATAPVFSFTNKLTAPQTIGLRATDADGVNSSGYDGSQTLRSGRLQMSNAFGGDKTSLQIPLQLQYWSGKSWVLNSADTCTVIPTASVVRAQTLNHNNTAASWSSAISSITLSGGSGSITLGAPSPSGTGTVDLSINLGATTTDVSCLANHPSSTGAGLPWLRSRQGSCASSFDRDPSARGTFGVYSPETQRSVHVRDM